MERDRYQVRRNRRSFGGIMSYYSKFPNLLINRSAPKVRTQSSGTKGTVTSLTTVPLPSATAGEIYILIIGCASDTAQTNTVPSGWTRAVARATAGYLRNFEVFWKVSDGTETSVGVQATTNHLDAWNVFVITGGQSVEATMAQGVSSVPDSPSITPSWGAIPTLFIAAYGQRAGTYTPQTAPAGYGNSGFSLQDAGYDYPRVGWAWKEATTASEDPAAWSASIGASPNGWGACTIAVQPK